MKPRLRIMAFAGLLLAVGCLSSRPPAATQLTLLSPGELLASLADVANGRNADLAEIGLALKRIELKLLVGSERRSGAHAGFLVLDVEASRRSEVSFTQTFTLELPPSERKRAAASSATVPGVAEFVDAAIANARELAAAAEREGLPQQLSGVELTAKIVRSGRAEGGVAFTGVGALSLGGGTTRSSDEANTVRLVFARRSP